MQLQDNRRIHEPRAESSGFLLAQSQKNADPILYKIGYHEPSGEYTLVNLSDGAVYDPQVYSIQALLKSAESIFYKYAIIEESQVVIHLMNPQ